MITVPDIRIRNGNNKKVNPDGRFVLYWMTVNRRLKWNYSLDRAIERAIELNKPVLILEALRCDYDWSGDRFHKFIIEGMACNYQMAEGKNIFYYPYVEPFKNAGKGLLEFLSEHACLIVSDDFPAFFIPDMIKSASSRINILFELVDSNGLLPLALSEREFTTAYSFRRFLQKQLPRCLADHPEKDPLNNSNVPPLKRLPEKITLKWPAASYGFLIDREDSIRNLPIDHNVKKTDRCGGTEEAERLLRLFIEDKLPSYGKMRNQPEKDATSNLSPYLHFGHISAHEIFHRVQETERWHPGKLAEKENGRRSGWWGMSDSAEEFLDQLVTWRELGFNMCRTRSDYKRYESLPQWAKDSLEKHEMDEREYIYSPDQFENALTHDQLWNAAQIQLITEGRIHNYIRMLWGKKVLEWTSGPKDALDVLCHLNNKYALDGRDPNSYSGIFWIFGRYDRPWGPERKIFGKIRYMSSANTAKKVRVINYIKKYS